MTGRALIIRAATGAAVLAAAWWALRPLARPDLSLPQAPAASPRSSTPPTTLAALDDSAFRTPLWVAPPPPPPPASPPEARPVQLPPLKLQLLAIVRQTAPADATAPDAGHQFKALLYDPDTDKLLEVAAGQTIGDRIVVGITQREITLKDRAGTRTLSLHDETRPAPGGGS